MKITIKNTEVELKTTMRAYLIYEQLNKEGALPNSLFGMLLFYYSVIMANARTLEFTFDEFVDYLDEDPELLQKLNEWAVNESSIKAQFKKDEPKKK